MNRIEMVDVDKSFIKREHLSFLGRVRSCCKRRDRRVVVSGLSLAVAKGQIIGISGRNGIGKSTILRLIAGIYKQDAGSIVTRGKIIALINLKVGLEWQLSMVDNIEYLGTLFEIPAKVLKRRIDTIISFAGLAGCEQTPVYQFSEGMKQRLVFSVAMHADADILLLDEIFEVGDEEFRKKSAKAIVDFAKRGGSVVLVTHEKKIMDKYCAGSLRL